MHHVARVDFCVVATAMKHLLIKLAAKHSQNSRKTVKNQHTAWWNIIAEPAFAQIGYLLRRTKLRLNYAQLYSKLRSIMHTYGQ